MGEGLDVVQTKRARVQCANARVRMCECVCGRKRVMKAAAAAAENESLVGVKSNAGIPT